MKNILYVYFSLYTFRKATSPVEGVASFLKSCMLGQPACKCPFTPAIFVARKLQLPRMQYCTCKPAAISVRFCRRDAGRVWNLFEINLM